MIAVVGLGDAAFAQPGGSRRLVRTPLGDSPSPKIYAAGTADDRDGMLVAAELAKLPPRLLAKLHDQGTRVVVCRTSVTEYRTDLRGVHPRGWPQGSTWGEVSGLYDPARNEVVVASDGRRILNSGSINVVHHETTHALDRGGDGSDAPTFRAARDADLVTLSLYERQPGAAGRSETFAESLARYLNGAEKLPHLASYWDGQGFLEEPRREESLLGRVGRVLSDVFSSRGPSARTADAPAFKPSATVNEFVRDLLASRTPAEIGALQRLRHEDLARELYRRYARGYAAPKTATITQRDYDRGLDALAGRVTEISSDRDYWRAFDNGWLREDGRRIYLDLAPDGSVAVANDVIRGLDAAGVKFQAKLPRSLGNFSRSDTMLVYVDASGFSLARSTVLGAARAHPEAFVEGTPPFTLAIGRGIATAVDPSDTSFGEAITNMIAAGIQVAGPGAGAAEIQATVARVMRDHFHMDPDAPASLGRAVDLAAVPHAREALGIERAERTGGFLGKLGEREDERALEGAER